MNISAIGGFVPTNLSNSAKNASGSLSEDVAALLDGSKKAPDEPAKPAASSQSRITGTAFSCAKTAGTLWQVQSFAQSDDADVIDVDFTETDKTLHGQDAGQSDADKFLDFMSKTPDEIARDAILKELGYSEDDLAAMSPDERGRVENEIQQRLEIKISQSMQQSEADADHVEIP